MKHYYHVSYHALPRSGGQILGSAAVTWDRPLTTFRDMEELRHRIEDTYNQGRRDSVVIIAIWPLPDEVGS